ncbi:hypothetical protein EY777_08260, partial [Escherichia coli]|nr:hypothetical protein [Escherichia coli]
MRKINKLESKRIFLRGWFRFLRSVDRAKKNRPRQEKNGSLRFANETTPVQNQVVTFIEKISIINEYDSSILRRDAERILI